MRRLFCLAGVVAFFAVAPAANAYIHASVCQDRLHHTGWNGDLDGDNDIHLWGQSHGWFFNNEGSAWHPGGRADYVNIDEWYYNGSGSYVRERMGCHGSDTISNDSPFGYF